MMDSLYEFVLHKYEKINENKYMMNKQMINNKIMDELAFLQDILGIQQVIKFELEVRLMIITNHEVLKQR
jgi:hypothetical protein